MLFIVEVMFLEETFITISLMFTFTIDIKTLSQTSFGYISINSSAILTVSMATESP